MIAKLEKDIDNHLKKDYPDSSREKCSQIQKEQWKLTRELEQRHEKNS